jgi:hypothetical protein
MRRLIRTALAVALVAALAAVTAATVAAGNYAETSITGGGDTPPTAGEERELRLLLLQHGVTPVDHGSVQLTAWLPGTDESISVPATSVGDGEWLATVTFPSAGDWQMRIVHSEFETPAATAFAVTPAAGAAWMPIAGTVGVLLLAAFAIVIVVRRTVGGRAADEPLREPIRAG